VIKNVCYVTSDDLRVAMIIRKAAASYPTIYLTALFLVLLSQNSESYILQLRMKFNTFNFLFLEADVVSYEGERGLFVLYILFCRFSH
jgi:hypothetical protein